MTAEVKDISRSLVVSLKQGSQTAFNAIYSAYSHRLYSYCYKFCRTAEDAEEIVQDTFVRLWNNRMTIDNDTSLNNLLFTISYRLVVNAWRKRLTDPAYIASLEGKEQIADSSRTDHSVEYDEFTLRVNQLIDRLPPAQRKIVRLSKIEDMPNKKIAAMMGISEQTVKNQLSQGLKLLRRQLGNVSLSLLLFSLSSF